jgi:hypothetical protein
MNRLISTVFGTLSTSSFFPEVTQNNALYAEQSAYMWGLRALTDNVYEEEKLGNVLLA